jgi:predicted aspartyl protease
MRGRYYVLGVLIGLAVVGQPSASGYRETAPGQTMAATVSFDLYWDYLIVVRGSAGPLKGLNFLLDTGASPTVLDRKLAQKLHLEELPASITVLDGSVQATKGLLPSLSFGPIQRDALPVFIEDLTFLQKALPIRLDGVIGLDVLGQNAFVVDYSSRKIHFGTPPPLQISIPLRMKEGLPIVEAVLNDAPVHLLLDTGASSLIIFETKMPSSVTGLKINAVARSSNLNGDFERRQVQLHSLRLGEAEFGHSPAFMVHNLGGAGRGFDGLMSPAALHITRIAFDLQRGVLAFSR